MGIEVVSLRVSFILMVLWSEEVEASLKRVKRLELMKTIEEIEPRAKRRRVRVDSTRLIREDRETEN